MYRHDQPKSYKRDWTVIGLLYLSIALMLSTMYFAMQLYMAEGEITKLERSSHEQQ